MKTFIDCLHRTKRRDAHNPPLSPAVSLPRPSQDEQKEVSQESRLSASIEKFDQPPKPLDPPIITPSSLDPEAVPTTTYPEGGREAWLVVFGAFCGLTASLGIYNTSGVFSAVLSNTILPETSPSNLGWLFSIYAFVCWICGVQIGPTFDAMGPRYLIIAGTVCTAIGLFAMSFATEYWQILLSFSILTGIGSSLLLTPSMGCVAHWFHLRRGLASGIAFIGGGFGGVLFPLMIQSLLPRLSWPWTLRVIGFVDLALCTLSIAFCRSRHLPRAATDTKPSWRDTLPSHRIFLDGTGAMTLTTAGVLLTDLAYFIPVTFIPSYYLARQNLTTTTTTSPLTDSSSAFAYHLLAILNGSSCAGRLVTGSIGDALGRYNTMILSLLLCTLSVLTLWLPDILLPELSDKTLLILFVILFGFVSGANVSLTPICLGQLCATRDYGRYYASCYTAVGVGVLGSLPLAGALLDAVEATGKGRFWAVAVFTGLCYGAALGCFVAVRVRVKGWRWRVKW